MGQSGTAERGVGHEGTGQSGVDVEYADFREADRNYEQEKDYLHFGNFFIKLVKKLLYKIL